MLLQAILIGLIGAWGTLDYSFGSMYTFRPIILSVFVGLVLGDVHTGIVVGASLELLFMGAISIGAYLPPDVAVGGVLATAFAISMGQGTKAAIALAMPIAVIALGLNNLIQAILPMFLKHADNGAEKGSVKQIMATHWVMGLLPTLMRGLLCFGAFYVGVDAVKATLDVIPDFVLTGMGIAAGMLPAMGFAMLMRMILNKKLVPFFFLGFAITAYANVPVLGIAIIAIVVAIEKMGFFEGKKAAAADSPEEVDEDDEDF